MAPPRSTNGSITLPTAGGWVEYSNPLLGAAFQLPGPFEETWDCGPITAPTGEVELTMPIRNGLEIQVNTAPLTGKPGDLTFEAMLTKMTQTLKEAMEGAQVSRRKDGLNSLVTILSAANADHVMMVQMAPLGRYALIITLDAPKARGLQPEADRIAKSVRVIGR
jgi:hypothetical protein